jgi:hypothetical protein
VRLLLALLIAATASGQTPGPPGFVRGVVTTNTVEFFAVRANTGDVFRYRTDSKTWIERDHERIRAASLKPGEILEVVSDRDPDPIRYARMIHVIKPVIARPLPVSSGGVYRLNPDPQLPSAVYTGLVIARAHDHITLRTRFDGDKTIYLQPDTEYLKDGNQVDAKALLPLARVYVVSTRNNDHEFVANQIVWGAILEPQP